MRIAVVESGHIVNVLEAADLAHVIIDAGQTKMLEQDALDEELPYGGAMVQPAPAVPDTISDRQFAQGLAMQGLITKAEALAWVKAGAVPPELQSIIDAISDVEVRFASQMVLSGATSFNRQHPMVEEVRAAKGWSAQQVLDLWSFCAAL